MANKKARVEEVFNPYATQQNEVVKSDIACTVQVFKAVMFSGKGGRSQRRK